MKHICRITSYNVCYTKLLREQFLSPVNSDGQLLGGSVEAGVASVAVTSDSGATCSPVLVNGTTWSCPVSGLLDGAANTFSVSAVDSAGNVGTSTRIIDYRNNFV